MAQEVLPESYLKLPVDILFEFLILIFPFTGVMQDTKPTPSPALLQPHSLKKAVATMLQQRNQIKKRVSNGLLLSHWIPKTTTNENKVELFSPLSFIVFSISIPKSETQHFLLKIESEGEHCLEMPREQSGLFAE